VGATREVTDPIFMVVGLAYVCVLIFGSAIAPAVMQQVIMGEELKV